MRYLVWYGEHLLLLRPVWRLPSINQGKPHGQRTKEYVDI